MCWSPFTESQKLEGQVPLGKGRGDGGRAYGSADNVSVSLPLISYRNHSLSIDSKNTKNTENTAKQQTTFHYFAKKLGLLMRKETVRMKHLCILLKIEPEIPPARMKLHFFYIYSRDALAHASHDG